MTKKMTLWWYGIFVAVLFAIDRITKYYALIYWASGRTFSDYLSCTLVMNRGISWGLLHQTNNALLFGLLTGTIIALTLIVANHAWILWQQRRCIAGELMVLVGSVSNIIDRLWYGGIIDFIACRIHSFSWPVFNVADVWIVLGILLMFILHMRRQQ